MIKQVKISGTPPYIGDEQTIDAKQINFLFGLNGTGKTTISRFLRKQDDPRFSQCAVEWIGSPLKCEVYNRDYVDENFGETSVPGIFTLGEENISVKQQIETITKELSELQIRAETLNGELNGTDNAPGLYQRQKKHEEEYTDKFWQIKQQLDREQSSLNLAITGVRSKKDAFKSKIIAEKQGNQSELKEKADLEKQCSQLFVAKAEKANPVPIPSFGELLAIESNDILQRVIVGKEDVDISGLIKKLGIDGWFKQGVSYLDQSEGVCPFCQRPLEDDFVSKIRDYFDESYLAATSELSKVCDSYTFLSDGILRKIKALIDSPSDFIKIDELNVAYQQLLRIVDENKRRLLEKKASPNIVVQLDSIKEFADAILSILKDANSSIDAFNIKIEHIKDEREALTNMVWRYIVETVSADIEAYKQVKESLETTISETKEELKTINNSTTEKTSQLRTLEQTLTSIVPTAKGINDLLQSYGLTGFFLKVNDTDKTYQLIRADGSSALQSLSEGERNFVTFLYFIYSLRGNKDESGHNDDKVVVIDDPVSSLDNDVLFLVSTLVRDLFKDIYDGNGAIKQLFVLSHNTYFYKEVTFEKGITVKKTGYWMITKSSDISKIRLCEKNPISSTYEMLWDDVRTAAQDPSGSNTLSLSNTMRRIVEYYFKFLGGIDLNKFHLQFPDGERQIFKSLISWANAGSHSAFDDYSATPSLYSSENYLKVFKDLFDKTKHIAHYNMMMRIVTEEENNG